MTMGADPIAVATALVARLEGRRISAFSVRKEAKGHGIGGRLVGPVGKGDQGNGGRRHHDHWRSAQRGGGGASRGRLVGCSGHCRR